MTEPYEGYTCWRLKDGQSCDYCPEYLFPSVDKSRRVTILYK